MKGLFDMLNSESDQEFLDKHAKLEAFSRKFKGFSGKTLGSFSIGELEAYAEIIKEFFSRHQEVQCFSNAAAEIRSDTTKGTYI